MLPVGVPLVIPGQDEVTAHIGKDADEQQRKDPHQKGGLSQHQDSVEAVSDREGNIMVGH